MILIGDVLSPGVAPAIAEGFYLEDLLGPDLDGGPEILDGGTVQQK